MKVFEMDDCTWYAAETLAEAQEQYLSDGQLTRDDLIDLDPPSELSDEQLETLRYVEHDLTPEREPISFRRALELMIERGDKFPSIFASTEW